MPRVHLFNPENDIALAHGARQFTAPKAAIALRNSGAALPIWYSNPGDRLLAYGLNAKWLDLMNERFGMDVDIFDHISSDSYQAMPWGWSYASKREFSDEGFSPNKLPTDSQLDQWRQMSHRRTAAKLRELVAPCLDFEIAPAAIEISDINTLTKHLASDPDCIIKAPWSSSGRGLTDARCHKADEVIRRSQGVINKQGSVMVEHAYKRLADFAMLFECSKGECHFIGYSLFNTDSKGYYCGNILADDQTLLDAIGHFYPAEHIAALAVQLQKAVTQLIANSYSGPLGIDMLIAEMPDNRHLLDATVELNLRMTMGFVAHSLSNRYIAPDCKATFTVMPERQAPASETIVIEDRHIVSGRMMLTPPVGQFRFIVESA